MVIHGEEIICFWTFKWLQHVSIVFSEQASDPSDLTLTNSKDNSEHDAAPMISQVSFFQVRITGKQVTYPRLQGRRAAQAMHIKCLFLPGGFRYFGYSDLELGGRRVQ